MFHNYRFIKIVFSITVIVSAFAQSFYLHGQDLVSSESLAGGGSAFVFRESRKKPQAKFGVGFAFLGREGAAGGGGGRLHVNSQIAAAAKKRRAAAAARRRAAIAAANKKIALSNTLTAKAETSLDNEQTDLAITNFRAALVQNPKNSRAASGLSEALTAKGIEVAGDANNDAAIVYFDEAIKLETDNDIAYAKLGAIYDAKNQNDKAIANYEKALAINPDLSTLYAPLGLAYLETGEIAKAETCLQKADKSGSDTFETRYLRGLVLLKQNKNTEALAAFDRVLELDGRNAMAHYYRGQVFDRLGSQDKMIAAYRKSLDVDPTFAPASYDLGVAYYNNGEYENAAGAYQQTIKYDDANAQAHANLASTYRQLERYPEANGEYKIAAVTINQNPDLYSEWGFCLGKTNEWETAVIRLNTARELSPQAIDNSNLGWAYYNAAGANAAAKDDAAAKANYELGKTYLQKAVEQDPRLDAAYLNLGSTYNGLGEFQAAVSALNTAVGLHSNWVIAINQLGVGYRGLNDLVNAVATFKRVVDLDGNSLYGLFNLGEAYNASGNKKEAKKVQDRLKKLNPAFANRLGDVLSGKISVPGVNVPKPRIPRIPY